MDLTLLARERVGKVLRGKYHLDRLIDVGGMAAVYEATHRNGTRSAIKVLHPKYVSDVQARTRFLREGYAANHVGHPGSVTVIDDDFTEEGDVYLVMELLDGESLEGCIAREKTMSEIDVLSIADQLLDVLSSAHHKDIIHRDIKPANIMLTRSGIVKLLDFGLARVRELPAVAGVHSAEIVFGTVAYVSPEAARANNDEMDGRADLWAVAATMFKALAGETVHGMNGSVMERLIRAAKEQARSLGSVAPHLHPRVVDVVDRALMFNREDRWPSAAVMQAVTQDVLAQLMEERGSPPSMFFMPGLSQMVAGYSSGGPMTSMSASHSPTPRPFRGQTATPSPSPYPYPGAMATPSPRPAPNPLNQVAHNPLNQVRGRPAQPSHPQQGNAGYTTNYANPLNQVASRPRSVQQQPQPQPQRAYNPLNRVATPARSHQRPQGQPQNQAPSNYAGRQPVQTRAYGTVDPEPADSSFDIEIEDLDPGSSAGDLDLAITIEESREEPAPRPRRATTMRDLGSAAARARAMLDSRRRGVMAPTPTPAPEPEPEPEIEDAGDDDFDIDIGFDDEFADADELAAAGDPLAVDEVEEDDEDGAVEAGGPATEVDTVRRPPPTLPSEETVRRPAPTGPEPIAPRRSEDTVRGPAPVSGSLPDDTPRGMEAGIIIEQIDDDEAWPDEDPWAATGVSGESSEESRVYDDLEDEPYEDEPEPEPETETDVDDEPTPPVEESRPGRVGSGLLGLPPLSSGLSGARSFGAPMSRADAEAKREAAEAKRRAAEEARKAALAERRAAAAAERKAAAEQRRLQARQAAELREEERRKKRTGKPLPPRPQGTGLGLERLSSLRRPSSAPVVVDRDSPTLTSPDRTVRVAIPTPSTLPDLGVGQRSSRAPFVPKVSPPKAQQESAPSEAEDDGEEVAELSDSMFIHVPGGVDKPPPTPVAPPRMPAPPTRTPAPPSLGSSGRRPPKAPVRPPAKKPEGKSEGEKPALRLPRLRKLPPRKK